MKLLSTRCLSSPADLKAMHADYHKDPDFDGYLYLYDSEVIEEEVRFEELLLGKEISEMEKELAEQNKIKALEFVKFAEDKVKGEKKKGMIGIFQEKKNGITSGIANLLKKKKAGEEDTHENAQNITHDYPSSFKKLDTGRFEESLRYGHETKGFKGRAHQGQSKEEAEYLGRRKEKRLSLDFTNDLRSVEDKIRFFRTVIFDGKFAHLCGNVKKLLKSHYEDLIEKRSRKRDKYHFRTELVKDFNKQVSKSKGFGPWEVLWKFKKELIEKESPYSEFPSYRLRQIIVKGGDDLRQEIIAMQVLKKLQEVFKREGTSLVLRTYEIVVISASSGVIGREGLC